MVNQFTIKSGVKHLNKFKVNVGEPTLTRSLYLNYGFGLLLLCFICCVRAAEGLNDGVSVHHTELLKVPSAYDNEAFLADYQHLQGSLELTAKRVFRDSAIALTEHEVSQYPKLINQLDELIEQLTDAALAFELKIQRFFLTSEFSNQVEYYQQIKLLLAQAPENISGIRYGYLLLDAANIALRLMQSEEGWQYFSLANKLAITLENKQFWSDLENSRGLALAENGHVDQALVAFKKALEYKKQLNAEQAVIYVNIAFNYFQLNQLDLSLEYANSALEYAQIESNRYVEVLTKTLFGRIAKSQAQHQHAVDWFLKSLELAKEENIRDYIFANYADSIYPLLHLGRINQALAHLDQAKRIAKQEQLDSNSYLLELEAVIKHYQKDYDASLLLFFETLDEVVKKYNVTTAKTTEQSRILMETQVRELENQRLRIQNDLKQAYLNDISIKNTWLKWLISIVSLFLLLLLVLVWYIRKVSKINHLHATTDELTQISNRRQILHNLHCLIRAASKTHQPLCVAMLDIDYFKKINDHCGHLIGDLVLIEVARVAQNSLRPNDLIGRLGGEEFLLVMPNTTLAQASVLCESVRTALHDITFKDLEREKLFVSGSFGVATLIAENEKSETLIHRADMALYYAKQNGRDQISCKN